MYNLRDNNVKATSWLNKCVMRNKIKGFISCFVDGILNYYLYMLLIYSLSKVFKTISTLMKHKMKQAVIWPLKPEFQELNALMVIYIYIYRCIYVCVDIYAYTYICLHSSQIHYGSCVPVFGERTDAMFRDWQCYFCEIWCVLWNKSLCSLYKFCLFQILTAT